MGCYVLLQGILPTQGLGLSLLASLALAGGFFTTSTTWETPHMCVYRLPQWLSGKGSPALYKMDARDLDSISGSVRSMKEEMATHSSILAWKIPQRSLVVYSPWGLEKSQT